MRVNAAAAACLVGVSEKTMRAWCAAGKIPGARKVSRLGQPEEWEIEMADLRAATAERIDLARLRMLSTWLDLQQEMLNPAPAPRPASRADRVDRDRPTVASSSTDQTILPESTGISMAPARYQAGMFRTAADAQRFLTRHGVNFYTPKTWPGWPPHLDAESVLALAIQVCDPTNHRITWRLHRCDDAACVCHRML